LLACDGAPARLVEELGESVAQRAHVDEGTPCDLFAGRRRPTLGTVRAICQALELSIVDVITVG
jgi:hypothetical protein